MVMAPPFGVWHWPVSGMWRWCDCAYPNGDCNCHCKPDSNADHVAHHNADAHGHCEGIPNYYTCTDASPIRHSSGRFTDHFTRAHGNARAHIDAYYYSPADTGAATDVGFSKRNQFR